MSTRKAFHELHPIIGGLNGRSFSERVVWGFVQLTYKREATTAVKIKDLFLGQCKNLRGKFINCYLCLQIHSLWS